MKLGEWFEQERGRQSALAGHLHLKPPQIADWVSGKKRVPLDHCPAIQDFTGGAVTCEELRPDKVEYFSRIRAQCADAAPSAAIAPDDRARGVAFADLPSAVRLQAIQGSR